MQEKMADQEPRQNIRLLLVPLPYEGHLNPMLRLASVLYRKGFSISIVYTDFNSPNPADHPNFTFLKIPNALSDPNISPRDFRAVVTNLNRNCEPAFQEILAQKMDQDCHYKEIGCIIYDTFMYFAEAVAKHFCTPSIIMQTTSATNLLNYKISGQLRKDGLIPVTDDLSSNIVPELHPVRFRDLAISNLIEAEYVIELLFKACDAKSSSGIILDTVDCLEESSLAQLQQHYQIAFFTPGPLHKAAALSLSSLYKEDFSCISWLDKQRCNSVIYVSLGSVARFSEEEFKEMSWGLANSRQPFLWVVRADLTGDSKQTEVLLPEGFEQAVGDRGCIVKWAPQKEVLAHRATGGFWSHCGWNSTLESISEGVPIICNPSFGDQKVNARYISHVWKVGLQYENEITRGKVANAIRKLMFEQEGMDLRLRALTLKNKIQLALQPGGSSYTSLNELVKFILSSKQPKQEALHLKENIEI